MEANDVRKITIRKPIGASTSNAGVKTTGSKANIEFDYADGKTIINCNEAVAPGTTGRTTAGRTGVRVEISSEDGNNISVQEGDDFVCITCPPSQVYVQPVREGQVELSGSTV